MNNRHADNQVSLRQTSKRKDGTEAGLTPILDSGEPLESKTDKEYPTKTSLSKRVLQVLSIGLFLIAWVANSEILQGLSSGSFGAESYPKPTFITWYTYNFMSLSLFGVIPYVRSRKWTLSHYVCHVWAGKLGLKKCLAACAVISYCLQLLNVLVVLGLECVSVSLSNAVFQVQAAFTVGLSVCLLRKKIALAEFVGIMVCTLGICLIVIPPIVDEDVVDEESTTCLWPATPILAGTLATVSGAVIGGAYLVFWRVFDERRHAKAPVKLDGLIDGLMTLAAIGLSNLILGLPILGIVHWAGMESFEWPSSQWWLLHVNGIVEYIFDVSCALAIYMTSPVLVAISSALTLPLSIVVDQYVNPGDGLSGSLSFVGAAITVVGVYIMEAKPNMFRERRNYVSTESDKSSSV